MYQPNNTNITPSAHYNKVLTKTDLILSNIGYIIGAGVFVLIGKTFNIAGTYAWLSVLISGLFIYFISKSFIKVHTKYLTNDAEYVAIKETYGATIYKFTIIITVIAHIAITYIVALGFGSYTNSITNNYISSITASIIGIVSCMLINIYGIEFTTNINNIITIFGVGGLCILIILGGLYIYKHGSPSILIPQLISHISVKNINKKSIINILNILYGAFIFIFAYFGFELIIRFNDETVNNVDDIPSALNYSILISIILYTLIMVMIIGVYTMSSNGSVSVGSDSIGNSINPLSIFIKKLTSNNFIIKYVELCGVGLTWNTILLSIANCSRLLVSYTSSNSSNPSNPSNPKTTDNFFDVLGLKINNYLKQINPYTQTPINSILFISCIVLLLILVKLNILTGTIVSNASLLLIMLLVYLSS